MKRNHFLDILKGISILFITATHYDFTDQQRLDYFFPFWIDMAVPVFMLISGYVATASFRKRNITTIEQAYAMPITLTKLFRYTIPFAMAWLVEVAFMVRTNGIHNLGPISLLIHFMKGGDGAGAFYYPLLMQLVFVFPLIYFLIERQGFFGLILAFVGTYVMEIAKGVYQMEENTYCLLIFRYTFIIAVGVYLASSYYKPRWVVAVVAVLIGFAFIFLTEYHGLQVPFIDYWKRTSLFGCLYIAPIVGTGLYFLKDMKIPPLEFLGKASYNIFLTQKIYYTHGRYFYDRIPGEKYDCLVTMVIILAVGIVFYLISEPITKAICNRIKAFAENHPIPEAWH